MKKNRVIDKYKQKPYIDYSILFLTILLVGFGLVMVFSTSSYKSTISFGYSHYWLLRQAVFAAVGLILMFLLMHVNYEIFRLPILTWGIYLGCIGSLIMVLAMGAAKKGSVRWIEIGPVQIQPSEFAKVFLILFFAQYLAAKGSKIKTLAETIKTFVFPGIIVVLVVIQNLSTALVLVIISGVMFVIAAKKIRYILAGGAIGVVGLIIYLLNTNSYRNERIAIWLHPETHEKGLQTMQALYAIGSGGLFGKGLGQSMQKMGFIPESHNDMIFSIICEELGLFGAICLIGIFVALIWRMLIIALNARDLFGSLIVIGCIAHIAAQVLVNIAVVTNTIPPTGIPLPFISYGGSSIITVLIEMGLVLSVARKIQM